MVPNSVLAFVGRKVSIYHISSNIFILKFSFLLFEKIVKFAKNFDKSPWQPYFIKNKEFYDWI